MLFRRTGGSSWSRHLNPDGSQGGLVAISAQVANNVHIDRSAIVAPHVCLPQGAVLREGEIATQSGIISFHSKCD